LECLGWLGCLVWLCDNNKVVDIRVTFFQLAFLFAPFAPFPHLSWSQEKIATRPQFLSIPKILEQSLMRMPLRHAREYVYSVPATWAPSTYVGAAHTRF
jgi:hypothetical protein